MYQKCSSAPGWTLLDSNGNQIKTRDVTYGQICAHGRGGWGITSELDMLTKGHLSSFTGIFDTLNPITSDIIEYQSKQWVGDVVTMVEEGNLQTLHLEECVCALRMRRM